MTVLMDAPIRLLLGGRTTRIEGFLNVDLFDGESVDIRTDASDLCAFKDGTIKEIYASHILEHFSHTKTLDVLKEWGRVLEPKGKLYLSVPDFDRAIELMRTYGLTQYIVNLLWGDQGYDLAYHYAPFNSARLLSLLMKAGFSDASRISELPHGIDDCSKKVDNAEHKPISLNMVAIK